MQGLSMAYIDFKQLQAMEQEVRLEPAIQWQASGLSDIGRVQKVNEDAFYLSADQGLWAVADGMGGFARGDYASGVVVDGLAHFTRLGSLADNIRDLEMRLKTAHNLCRTSFPGERVGSTVAAIFAYGNHCMVLWAGDSRVYRLRGDHIKQITVDHTVAQYKYAQGELSAQQAISHPLSHILTRAIGVHQVLYLDLEYVTVEPGDRFLLCSDGLYNEVPRADIQALLGTGQPKEAVQALVENAVANGGKDNITAIVLDAVPRS